MYDNTIFESYIMVELIKLVLEESILKNICGSISTENEEVKGCPKINVRFELNIKESF